MNGRRFTRRLAAVARRLGWGRSALRRRSDRIENIVVLAAIVLAVGAVPLALTVGTAVYHHNLDVSAAQTAARHQVTATLLNGTSTPATLEGPVSTVPVNARWIGPDGSRHVGVIQAIEGSGAGSLAIIWTDAHGVIAQPPLNPAEAWGRGAAAGTGVLAAVMAVLATIVGVIRWRLNRVRYAAWDAEWRQIDPRRTRYTN